ncbi:SIMPL domain-containing protein [Palleronia sp. KMU-117]|uniref:SIMPL domain-containing protein n=1 Tax=Palleronia sp. KMU-117 TaxID=3434108 RepID=UPI003D751CF8
MRLPFAPVLALVLLALPALAQEVPRTIVVSGLGEVSAVPDMAYVTLGAQAEAATAAEALAATSAAVAASLEVLTGAGIDARDIQTSGISLSPRMVWPENGNGAPRIEGYVASNQLTVRVRDLEVLGGVLDAVVSSGANTLGGVSFALSEPRAAEDDARRAAVEDARARAALYAEAAGVTLGPVREIAEEGFSQPMPRMMAAEAAMSDAAPPVAPGELTVSARVRVVYSIAD